VMGDVKNEFLLAGKEDAANNIAHGHYIAGKEMFDKVNDRVRKMVGVCDNVHGFIVKHSVGSMGSRLYALMLERIAVDYCAKSKLGFEVQPSPTILTCVVEPYNALLTTHGLLDYTEISVLLGNEAMHEICQKHLDIKRSSYDALSRLIVKAVSSMTAPLHFEGELDVDMNEFQTNLEPFPRLHFVITTMAPIMTERKETTNNEMRPITELCFSAQRFFAKITDCDAEEHKYMADSGNYRGLVKAKEAYATAQWLKINKQVTLVEWMPTDFKVRLNEVPAARVGDDRQ